MFHRQILPLVLFVKKKDHIFFYSFLIVMSHLRSYITSVSCTISIKFQYYGKTAIVVKPEKNSNSWYRTNEIFV